MINNILLFYNAFFKKRFEWLTIFSCENAILYFEIFVKCTETNLLVIKTPTFDSYNIYKDIRIYILF